MLGLIGRSLFMMVALGLFLFAGASSHSVAHAFSSDPVNLVSIGDSISSGKGSYRGQLKRGLEGAGFEAGVDFRFVGTNYNWSPEPGTAMHMSWGGYTPQQILEGGPKGGGVAKDLRTLEEQGKAPDIAIIHAGTNGPKNSLLEPLEGKGYGQHVDYVRQIVDAVFDFNPEAVVILTQIVQKRAPSPNIFTFNDQLEVMWSEYDNRDQVLLVNLEDALDEYGDYNDNTHPNLKGLAKMGDVLLDPTLQAMEMATTPVATPLPAGAVLLALGLGGLGIFSRHKSRS